MHQRRVSLLAWPRWVPLSVSPQLVTFPCPQPGHVSRPSSPSSGSALTHTHRGICQGLTIYLASPFLGRTPSPPRLCNNVSGHQGHQVIVTGFSASGAGIHRRRLPRAHCAGPMAVWLSGRAENLPCHLQSKRRVSPPEGTGRDSGPATHRAAGFTFFSLVTEICKGGPGTE